MSKRALGLGNTGPEGGQDGSGHPREAWSADPYASPGLSLPGDDENLGARLMDCLKGRNGQWFLMAGSRVVAPFTDSCRGATGTILTVSSEGIEIKSCFGAGTSMVMSVAPDGQVSRGNAYEPALVEMFLTTPILSS